MSNLNLNILRPAAENGNIDLLYHVLKNEPSILEDIDSEKLVETPLHIAASNGHIPFAIEIMNWKPSFALKLNPAGLSPIHLAIENKNLRMVLSFVDMNVDLVRVKGKGGWTPLHLASEIGDVEILAELICACPDSLKDLTVWGETALHIAARNGKYDALHLLVYFLMKNKRRGARMMEYKILNKKDELDNTILHISVQNNYPKEMIQLLTKTKIHLNAENFENKTALDMAVMTVRDDDVKSILLKAGAKPGSGSAVTHSQRLASDIKLKIIILDKAKICISRMKSDMLDGTRDTMLIIMTLIVTTTYQSVLSPPGGFYQANASDNDLNITSSNSTIILGSAGRSVMSEYEFTLFSCFSIVSFLSAITSIVVMVPGGSKVLFPLYFLTASYLLSMSMICPSLELGHYEYINFTGPTLLLLIYFTFFIRKYYRLLHLFIANKLNRS